MIIFFYLFDCYEFGEIFGFGGMFEVYLVCDFWLYCDVVVKVLCVDLVCDFSFYFCFWCEV